MCVRIRDAGSGTCVDRHRAHRMRCFSRNLPTRRVATFTIRQHSQVLCLLTADHHRPPEHLHMDAGRRACIRQPGLQGTHLTLHGGTLVPASQDAASLTFSPSAWAAAAVSSDVPVVSESTPKHTSDAPGMGTRRSEGSPSSLLHCGSTGRGRHSATPR